MACRAPFSPLPTTRDWNRATTRPGTRRSPPMVATSRSRPSPATSSPTTTPTPRASTEPVGSSASTSRPGHWKRSPTAASSRKATTPSSAAAPSIPRSAPTGATSPSLQPSGWRPPTRTKTSTSTFATWVRRYPPAASAAAQLPARTSSSRPGTAARNRPITKRPRFPRPAATRARVRAAGWRSAPTGKGSCSAPKRRPTCRPARPPTCRLGRSSSETSPPTARLW